MADLSILLYGGTGSGKTTQLGVLAERVWKESKRRTRVYTADLGGYRTLEPYVKLGLMEVFTPPPGMTWQWIRYTTQGYVPDEAGQKWVAPAQQPDFGKIGAWCFEGFTSYCDLMMTDMAVRAEKGQNVGGAAPVMVEEGTVKVGGNNQAHYGMAQGAVMRGYQASTRLPGRYLVWTALSKRASDEESATPLLGPQLAGKALTDNAPAWFTYTFHLVRLPGDPVTKREDEHRLYLKAHKDLTVPGALAIGNERRPLDAPRVKEYVSPADLHVALNLVEEGIEQATAAIEKRLALFESATKPGA